MSDDPSKTLAERVAALRESAPTQWHSFMEWSEKAISVMEELSAEVERLRACERDARRYREVRRWTPITFMNATQVNLKTGKPFDEIVDDLMPFTDAAIAREAGT